MASARAQSIRFQGFQALSKEPKRWTMGGAKNAGVSEKDFRRSVPNSGFHKAPHTIPSHRPTSQNEAPRSSGEALIKPDFVLVWGWGVYGWGWYWAL